MRWLDGDQLAVEVGVSDIGAICVVELGDGHGTKTGRLLRVSMCLFREVT